MIRKTACAALFLLATAPALPAATLTQTVYFEGMSAQALFDLYASTAGHQEITGLPAGYRDGADAPVDRAEAGGRLEAFCFEPGKCALHARILDVHSHPGAHRLVMSWWNFGWLQATDKTDMTLGERGAMDSILTLTFTDKPGGAQIDLVQVNVPDYKVVIPSPDGSSETGPLSAIVNTHWHTLYWDKMRAKDM